MDFRPSDILFSARTSYILTHQFTILTQSFVAHAPISVKVYWQKRPTNDL